MELNKIIKGCKRKKIKHQELLYKQFYAYGMSICLRYSNSREDAVEILNDSFLKIYNNISKFDTKKSFTSWIRTIFINTAIDYSRKNIKLYKITSIEEVDYEIYDNQITENLDVEDILKLLNKLPNKYRAIFNLHEIEGYKHSEIAKKMEITESSSRTYLTRARKLLKKLYIQKYQNTYGQVI